MRTRAVVRGRSFSPITLCVDCGVKFDRQLHPNGNHGCTPQLARFAKADDERAARLAAEVRWPCGCGQSNLEKYQPTCCIYCGAERPQETGT